MQSVSVDEEWYNIRDTLLRHNHVKQDVKRALALAARCSHPDAVWLSNVFAGKDVNTSEEARAVFLALGESDARAVGFAAFLASVVDLAALHRSAALGFALAQAEYSFEADKGEESFAFASEAVKKGERNGFHWLGWWFLVGEGCAVDKQKANDCFLVAAKMGPP